MQKNLKRALHWRMETVEGKRKQNSKISVLKKRYVGDKNQDSNGGNQETIIQDSINFANGRKTKKLISSLSINGSLIEDPDHIEKGIPYLLSFSHQWPMLLAKFYQKKMTIFLNDFGRQKEQIPILHLQYVDDTLLFLDSSKNQLRNLISLIHCFELISCIKMNWQKSCLAD